MKRGQIQAMPLIYIFALIVAALILVLGFKYVYGLIATGEGIEIGNIKTEIDKQVQFIYNLDPGSSDEFSYRSPAKLKAICFGNPSVSPNDLKLERQLPKEEDRIFFETFLGNGDNLFFIMENVDESRHVKIEHLSSDETPNCITPKNNKITFILENKGKYVSAQ